MAPDHSSDTSQSVAARGHRGLEVFGVDQQLPIAKRRQHLAYPRSERFLGDSLTREASACKPEA